MTGDFDNVYDAVMAQRSEQYIYAGRRFPEPPPPTCRECDELIPEDTYDDPMPSVCPACYDLEPVPTGRGGPHDPGEQLDPDWATYV